MNNSLVTSLNKIREISSDIYHRYIPELTASSNIADLGTPILNTPVVANEFMSQLVNRIVYTQFEVKYFRNPLQILEGDTIPLGYAGQEIYVNPAKGRKFNVDDFAGLLLKYEADVKVQYTSVNMDLQYPVTVSRHKLKQAFVSWDSLNSFIDELSNSLYNGAYIDEYEFTKQLISGAYKGNNAIIKVVNAVNSEAAAKEFITGARKLFLDFQAPSTEFNSWSKLGGAGRPVTTWSLPEDIVFIVRNDIRSYIDVNVLASSFNIDKSELLGRIISVNNFDRYDDEGNKIFDGSKVIGMIADKKWFRIKRQDMFLDEFYNANNRTWNYYLNLTKMYNYSLFANHTIFATEAPTITTTGVEFVESSADVKVGETVTLHVKTTPINGTTVMTYTSSAEAKATVAGEGRQVIVTGVAAGTSTITVSAGSVTGTITVTVKA